MSATTQPTTPPAATGPAPWHRQPGEGPKPYAAWVIYRDMPAPKRSLDAVRKKYGKSARLIEKWSSVFRWQERLAAYTAHLERVHAEAIEEEGRRRAKVWADREQQAREEQYQLGQLLLAKGREMLAMPLKRRVRKCKGKVQILEPVGFNFGQVARVSEVGQKLVNLSVGAPTERTALTGKDGEQVVGVGAATVTIYLPAKDKDQRAAQQSAPPAEQKPPAAQQNQPAAKQ